MTSVPYLPNEVSETSPERDEALKSEKSAADDEIIPLENHRLAGLSFDLIKFNDLAPRGGGPIFIIKDIETGRNNGRVLICNDRVTKWIGRRIDIKKKPLFKRYVTYT